MDAFGLKVSMDMQLYIHTEQHTHALCFPAAFAQGVHGAFGAFMLTHSFLPFPPSSECVLRMLWPAHTKQHTLTPYLLLARAQGACGACSGR
eukprot:1161469-Pelagomonas_calceolata.AAC.43